MSFHLWFYLPARFPAVVLKVPPELRTEERVPLVCGGDDRTQDVFWKKDGDGPGGLGAVNYLRRGADPCLCFRHGAGAAPAGEPRQGPGGGDGRRKLHLPPRTGWTVPQPHRYFHPTGLREEGHPEGEIPLGRHVQEGRTRVFECCGGSKSSSAPPGYIHCSGPNYNGTFHCSWTRAALRSNAAVLLFQATR